MNKRHLIIWLGVIETVSLMICLTGIAHARYQLANATVYMDTNSLVRNGTLVKAKYVTDQNGECAVYRSGRRQPAHKYCSDIWYSEFDCANRMSRLIRHTMMSEPRGQGNVVGDLIVEGTEVITAKFVGVKEYPPSHPVNVAFTNACSK